jgi:dTDP-glucose 4,6-dehydratase
MKILVTGGCGFIGSNLIRHLLLQTEHSVVNLDKLTYAANPQSLADLADSPRYHFVHADLADGQRLDPIFQQHLPDAVMHLAAESHVDRSIDGPAAFIQSNIVGTFQLLEACLRYYRASSETTRQRFRLLHVSTDEVYGSLGVEGRFSETTPYDPHSPYAASKASSDHLVRAWHATYHLPVIVTNGSNNYGAYQFPEKLIPLIVIRALRDQSLPVYGRGENVRDWLYVEDHVRALMMVLERGAVGETYHIGGNNEQRNIDVVRTICEILDALKPRRSGSSYAELITFVEDRPGHDLRYAVDSGKIQSQLGWCPQHDWLPCLRRTVQWYLDHESWWRKILDGTYLLQRLGTR